MYGRNYKKRLAADKVECRMVYTLLVIQTVDTYGKYEMPH